jgi:hypothetical protein
MLGARRRKKLPSPGAAFLGLVALLGACAHGVVEEASPPTNRLGIPTQWIEYASVALLDFKQRLPQTWECYTVSMAQTRPSEVTIVFGSPAPLNSDPNIIEVGRGGECGPSAVYIARDDEVAFQHFIRT